MPIRKKGTPVKIKIVKESDLEQWRKFINDCINNEPFEIVENNKFKPKKSNKK